MKETSMKKFLPLFALVLVLSLTGCRTAFMAEPAGLCCPSGPQTHRMGSGHYIGGNAAPAPAVETTAPCRSYERTETETTTEGVQLPDGSTRTTTYKHLKVDGDLAFARYDRAMRGEAGTLQSDPSLSPTRRDNQPPPVEQQLQPLHYRSGGGTPFGGDYFGR